MNRFLLVLIALLIVGSLFLTASGQTQDEPAVVVEEKIFLPARLQTLAASMTSRLMHPLG